MSKTEKLNEIEAKIIEASADYTQMVAKGYFNIASDVCDDLQQLFAEREALRKAIRNQ